MRGKGRPTGTTISIELTADECKKFQDNQKKGIHSARVLRRQRILLQAHAGVDPKVIAQKEDVSIQTVYNTFGGYLKTRSTEDRPRSGRPEKASGKVKAHIVAIACTEAPTGFGRWTLSLLVDHVMQLEILDSVSKSTMSRILKKMN